MNRCSTAAPDIAAYDNAWDKFRTSLEATSMQALKRSEGERAGGNPRARVHQAGTTEIYSPANFPGIHHLDAVSTVE